MQLQQKTAQPMSSSTLDTSYIELLTEGSIAEYAAFAVPVIRGNMSISIFLFPCPVHKNKILNLQPLSLWLVRSPCSHSIALFAFGFASPSSQQGKLSTPCRTRVLLASKLTRCTCRFSNELSTRLSPGAK